MSWLKGAHVRLHQWFGRAAAEQRMDEEFRFHLEQETAKHLRAGLSAAEARRAAVLAFGGAERHREVMREARRVPVLDEVWRDVRYGIRSLGRTPGFTLAAVVTLALGIAATTLMFTVVNGVLLRPLPVHEPERLASVRQLLNNGEVASSVSLPEYHVYRDVSRGVFSALAAHHLSDVTLASDGGAESALGLDVSGNYFEVLGLQPALGRFFTSDRAAAVVVISHELWQTRFGSNPDAIGRSLNVNGQALTIIGVAPRGFYGTMIGARPAVWLPLELVGQLSGVDPTRHGWTWLQLFGRLEAAVTHEQAAAALSVAATRVARDHDYPTGGEPTAARVAMFSTIPARAQTGIAGFLSLLLVAGALVLLIAEVNVAGMLMARGSARAREMGVRLALGAGRSRLVRQLLTENLLLSALGGAAGIMICFWVSRYLPRIRPPFAAAFQLDFPLDTRVLTFAVAVSLLTGAAFGLAPALFTVQRDLIPTLKDGTPGGGRRSRMRGAMVAAQLALSLVLLITAGLFVRTLQNVLRTDYGFDARGVIALELNVRLNGYDEVRGRAFYEQLLERVRATAGVEAAAIATTIPLDGSWDQTRARVPGFDPPEGEPGFIVGVNLVSPDYFATLRMPLVAGRGFTPTDITDEPPRIVINRSFARRFWSERSPIGAQIYINGANAEIIGVVPDAKYRSLNEETRLFAYAPFGPNYSPNVWLHARVRGDPAASVAAIRQHIAALDPNVPPIVVTTMESVMGTSFFPQRLAAGLVGSFGAAGVFLAAIGLFGLLSFSVAERTREFGVRMALGASRHEVLRLVLQDGMKLLGIGVLVGLLCAFAVTRALRGLLYGLSPTDPITFAVVPLLLACVALIAAYLPARRATRVDPVISLRTD